MFVEIEKKAFENNFPQVNCTMNVDNKYCVPVDHPVLVAMVDALQDLLDTMGSISFTVELTSNNVFK